MKGLTRTETEKRFAVILLDSIDEALTTLGPNVKLSIYFHLETKFAISKQDIPDRIEDFTCAIEKIFGDAAKPLEILIMKHLNQKAQCNYKWQGPKWLVPDLTFEKYVKLIRLALEDNGITGDVEVVLDAREKPEQRI
jgi:hypothetical protein